MGAFLWASQMFWLNPDYLMTWANIWARYLLGFSGALIAALALFVQAQAHTRAPEFAPVARPFFVAGSTLIAYAGLAGLFGPPAPFFPANVINADVVIDLLGMPVQVLRSVAGLILVISIIRGLEIFEMEVDHRLEAMEQAHILQTERERVSRELHDGAIQTVYTAGLMVESIRKKLDSRNPLAPRLDRVISALQHTIHDLRQFITELEPVTPGENLAQALQKLADDPHLQTFITVEMTINYEDDHRLKPARAGHVLSIVQEAFNNVIRHAQAAHIWAVAERDNGQLQITVTDDGIGIPANYVAGFGLRNMRDRARLLGGSLRIEPHAPQGTQVILSIPWEEPQ
jgi:signal transduction histidine kinase